MKNLFLLVSLAAVSLGFSSCCSMFGTTSKHYTVETKQVRARGYDIVTEEIHTGGKDGMVETVEKKVPRYKTVTKKVRVKQQCVRLYCPEKEYCGTSSESFLKSTTAQGGVGSPHIGLAPSMKPLAP